MRKIIVVILITVLFTLTSCTPDDSFKPKELTEEMQLEADVNNLVHIGRINDVDLYRYEELVTAFFLLGDRTEDKVGDICFTGGKTLNFIIKYEGNFYSVASGIYAGLFTFRQLYQANVYVGCRYPVKTLQELERVKLNKDYEPSDEMDCDLYFKKCKSESNEILFSINGFDFYGSYDFEVCYALVHILIDGYDFNHHSGCGPSLDELNYIVVKDGYVYKLQDLVDAKHLLTYEIYLNYISLLEDTK